MQTASLLTALEESVTKGEALDKTLQIMQSRLKLAKDDEDKYKAESIKLPQQVSALTKRLRQSESDMEILQELYHSIHKDVDEYRKIQGLFPPDTIIFSSIMQEREKGKADRAILSSKITDLERYSISLVLYDN